MRPRRLRDQSNQRRDSRAGMPLLPGRRRRMGGLDTHIENARDPKAVMESTRMGERCRERVDFAIRVYPARIITVEAILMSDLCVRGIRG